MFEQIIVKVVVGVAAAIIMAIVAFFGRTIWDIVSGLWTRELRRIGDDWRAVFSEPVDESQETEEVTETVKLRQFGRYVFGSGEPRSERLSDQVLIPAAFGRPRERITSFQAG